MNPKEDVHIGSVKVYLQSLAYNVELAEQLDVIDYQSEQIGVCNVSGDVFGEQTITNDSVVAQRRII